MTEDQLEQETQGWLNDVGYTTFCGLEIVDDMPQNTGITDRSETLAPGDQPAQASCSRQN